MGYARSKGEGEKCMGKRPLTLVLSHKGVRKN